MDDVTSRPYEVWRIGEFVDLFCQKSTTKSGQIRENPWKTPNGPRAKFSRWRFSSYSYQHAIRFSREWLKSYLYSPTQCLCTMFSKLLTPRSQSTLALLDSELGLGHSTLFPEFIAVWGAISQCQRLDS